MGEYTLEELRTARNACKENGKPELMIFVEEPEEGRNAEPSVGEALASLDAEGIPYTRFRHIDSALWQIQRRLAETVGLNAEILGEGMYPDGARLYGIDPEKQN